MKCQRLLNELLVPGRIDSPDGPAREVSTQCVLEEGHEGSHVFKEES